MYAKVRELFGIDLRTLALYRIAVGAFILFDVIERLWDLRDFYTDDGILSRVELISKTPHALSFHLMTGSAAGQAVLFAIQGIIACALLVGWRTRLMTVLSWLFMASLHARNHLVCGGGDDYFRLLLFWSMFLPLGAHFSVDALRSGRTVERKDLQLCTWATAAMLLQNALVYWMAGVYKLREPVWLDGSAVYYALSVYNYSKDIADTLLLHPELLRYFTYSVFAIELAGPFLFFFPWKTGPVRTAATFLFLGMHAGFFFCMYLKNFPWVSGIAALLFLPGWFWDRISWRPAPPGWWMDLLRKAPAGERASTRPAWWTEAAAAAFLVFVAYWNIAQYIPAKIPAPIGHVAQTLSISQRWKMFCPPAKRSGWFVTVGKLKDGTEVDLQRNAPPTSERPSRKALHKNERWRRFMKNFLFNKNKPFWPGYGRYLCRQWNASHPPDKQLVSIEIVSMERTTKLDGTGTFDKRVAFRHSCAPPAKNAKKGPGKAAKPALKPPAKKALPPPDDVFIG